MADNQLDVKAQPICVDVRDIMEARRFYLEVLGCTEYQANEEWLQMSLGSSRFACRLNPHLGKRGRVAGHYGMMRGVYKPVPHCIVSLIWEDWKAIASRLNARRPDCVIERSYEDLNAPATISLLDPSGNLIEFRSMRNASHQAGPSKRLRFFAALISGAAAITMICLLFFWQTKARTQYGSVGVPLIPVGTCPNSLFCTR